MKIEAIKDYIPKEAFNMLNKKISTLRPNQEKAIDAGLFKGENLLVCTPTASGKTFIAELAFLQNIKEKKGKTIYIVPLKALASEKYKSFKEMYGNIANIGISIGNTDSAEPYLDKYDLIITTSEKFDSLIRHHTPWLSKVSTLIVDEIHLLNDPSRGPTLEILITLLKQILHKIHIIGLSATIGNPKELSEWLNAKYIYDTWRPVKLYQGTYVKEKIMFKE